MNHLHLAETISVTSAEAIDWDEAYAQFLPRIYNFCLYKVGDRAAAEDLTSTTFIEVWRCRHRYVAAKGALSTWMFSIAHRVVAQHYRRRRARELPLAEAGGLAAEGDVAAQAERRADIARLVERLGGLSERDHDLIALKYGAQLTNRDIAQLVGLSESNVGTILHRLVGRLRRELGENHE
ncbi:MAG TPA: sigma-70 family RNA polymerase sigma factor [Herpetosiphonaceae bacterium]|nr:sigma-70 family RNA polymerase sigma factor [Herpetosiphonaceae bacterium]